MLHLRHDFRDPELGSVFSQTELRSEGFIVSRSVHDGGRFDDAIERAVTTEGSDWSIVQIVLDGPHLVRDGDGETTLHPGEAFVSRDMRATTVRSLTNRSDFLMFGWRTPSSTKAHGRLRLSELDRARAIRLANEMSAPDTTEALGSVQRFVDAFAAAGIRIETSMSTPPAPARAFARALERTFFPLSRRPMAIDLARELDVCERHALRHANAFFEKYYASGSTWREYVHAMRVGLSAFFMSHPNARTEHVSRLVGFSSPTSFCHALRSAGLPSPTAIQHELLRA